MHFPLVKTKYPPSRNRINLCNITNHTRQSSNKNPLLPKVSDPQSTCIDHDKNPEHSNINLSPKENITLMSFEQIKQIILDIDALSYSNTLQDKMLKSLNLKGFVNMMVDSEFTCLTSH